MILVKLVGTSNALCMRVVVHGNITRKWIVKAWNITRETMEKKILGTMQVLSHSISHGSNIHGRLQHDYFSIAAKFCPSILI
jgi:hypothetical protein